MIFVSDFKFFILIFFRLMDLHQLKDQTERHMTKYQPIETSSFVQDGSKPKHQPSEAEKILSKRFPGEISRMILYSYHQQQLQKLKILVQDAKTRLVYNTAPLTILIDVLIDLQNLRDKTKVSMEKYSSVQTSFVQENSTKQPASEGEVVLSKKFPADVARRILYWYHHQQMQELRSQLQIASARLAYVTSVGRLLGIYQTEKLETCVINLHRMEVQRLSRLQQYSDSSFVQV